MILFRKLLVISFALILLSVLTEAWSDSRIHVTKYDIGADATNVRNHWKAKGSAKISANGIDLTQLPWVSGSVWHNEAVNFSNWEIEFDFEIKPRNTLIKIAADGFGLFYVKDAKLGKTFGTTADFVGLAIVFDTYRNGAARTPQMPFLQAHVLDGSRAYDWNADGIPSALVNVHVPIVGKPKSKLRVRYQNEALTVSLSYAGADEAQKTQEEFQIHGVHLPRGYYFGFGASCGLFCSIHNVLNAKVYSLDGRDHTHLGLPRTDLKSVFQDNDYVLWNDLGNKPSSSAVVLDYSAATEPVFFARAFDKGQLVPAVYLQGKLYGFPNNEVTVFTSQNAQILSYRYSRSSHVLWHEYSTQRLESEEFRERLVPVGFSNEGDVLNICRNIVSDADRLNRKSVTPSGLGVFTVSSGVCRYVNQIDSKHLEVLTTTKFSILITLPTKAV